jgi:hypothetical protein
LSNTVANQPIVELNYSFGKVSALPANGILVLLYSNTQLINSMRRLKMFKVAIVTCLILLSFPATAERLECEALKARVDARLQAKGVQSYTLEIVPISDTANQGGASSAVAASKGKEVGTCDGGSKRLIYTKGN